MIKKSEKDRKEIAQDKTRERESKKNESDERKRSRGGREGDDEVEGTNQSFELRSGHELMGMIVTADNRSPAIESR